MWGSLIRLTNESDRDIRHTTNLRRDCGRHGVSIVGETAIGRINIIGELFVDYRYRRGSGTEKKSGVVWLKELWHQVIATMQSGIPVARIECLDELQMKVHQLCGP